MIATTSPTSRLTDAFDRHERALTVGVEEELLLLDPSTHDLAPHAAALVRAAADVAVRTELPAAQVELVGPVCADAAAVQRALLDARRRLREVAAGRVRLAGAGTHPTAPAEGPISPGDRYARISREYQWAARRGLAWGLHVHVAVPGAARALAVHDALREWLPLLAAMAGNAPFHEGRDTGLHSVRPKLAEGFPRQGVPPAWGSWEAYAAFLRFTGGPDADPHETARELWWEVRLHPVHGTLEVRVCDQPATAAEAASLTAVVQALCGTLAARHDAGELPPPAARERIEENRWRALRHGLDAVLLPFSGREAAGERCARELAAELLAEVAPVARACGGADALARAADLLDATGSERQRAVARECGVDAVAPWLADRFDAELDGA